MLAPGAVVASVPPHHKCGPDVTGRFWLRLAAVSYTYGRWEQSANVLGLVTVTINARDIVVVKAAPRSPTRVRPLDRVHAIGWRLHAPACARVRYDYDYVPAVYSVIGFAFSIIRSTTMGVRLFIDRPRGQGRSRLGWGSPRGPDQPPEMSSTTFFFF
jgi:hypothetical protein